VHFPGSFPLLPGNPISLEVLQINQQPLPFFSAANKDTQVMVFVMDSLANSFQQQPVLGIYLPTE